MRNKFIDPLVGSSSEYPWPINHDAEEAVGKTRNISHSANTANVGLVRQQGEMEPLTLRYTGTILELAQVQAMWIWFNLCDERTIHFEDFEGNVYEVLITTFQPVRKRVARNQRDLVNAPTHIWTYSIEMDVISVISGPMAAVL